MTNYTKATNFAAKDSLASGNAAKVVKGTEIDTEFTNIETAVNSKSDSANPVFTGVAEFADGSASAPSITNTGDTNTGIFFPAADTIAFAEGGTETMRLDSSGNLGLGSTPPTTSGSKWLWVGTTGGISDDGASFYGGLHNAYYNSGWKYKNTGYAQTFVLNDVGQFVWNIAGSGTAGNAITFTQAMTLDASGQLGIGTTSPAAVLHAKSSATGANASAIIENAGSTATALLYFKNSASRQMLIGYTGASYSGGEYGVIDVIGAYPLIFSTNDTERARITSGGLFKVVNSGSTIENSTGGVNEINTAANDTNTVFRNTASSLTGARAGIDVVYTASTPNGTTVNFYNASDATAKRFEVRSNGGIGNYSANNVNLSDRREKTNFAPAGDYLAKICAIPVQTYNYIDQNLEEDDGLTLGVVAQDVQTVAPELVTESNWGTEEEPKMRLSIYQTDLQYALMKCIQEQQAIITQLQADVAALKGQA